MVEPGGLQSTGSQRVGHYCSNLACTDREFLLGNKELIQRRPRAAVGITCWWASPCARKLLQLYLTL